jgi:TfoX/Sxy family transcriptional regulator of competence genes
MAYDEELAERIRSAITVRDGVTERKMFGGVAWMVHGNMACGVIGEDMIVRLEESDAEQALTEPGVRPFDFTGRPMRSTLFVGPEATAEADALARWVDAGADHAASLPPK